VLSGPLVVEAGGDVAAATSSWRGGWPIEARSRIAGDLGRVVQVVVWNIDRPTIDFTSPSAQGNALAPVVEHLISGYRLVSAGGHLGLDVNPPGLPESVEVIDIKPARFT
jgi:hypothetical protein